MNNLIKKNKKRIAVISMVALSSLVFSACSITPKPAPSWPSGAERPINKIPDADTTKKAK